MDLLGINVSDTAIKITAISGIFTTISGVVWGIIERKGKKKAQEISNNTNKITNADMINGIYNNLLKDIDEAEIYRKKFFQKHIDFCNKHLGDFIEFIKQEDATTTKS